MWQGQYRRIVRIIVRLGIRTVGIRRIRRIIRIVGVSIVARISIGHRGLVTYASTVYISLRERIAYVNRFTITRSQSTRAYRLSVDV